ncbi:hypothetical protein DDE82_003530 [Stemphylium lycopersici]|uniref:STEEP1 domain-containing protein n=1 Tax=Stemphylium lycopersici TaxID=183478 RepID=A0A364NC56_STELY|nr:hypothetical protein TW65_00593 [Stemphylium lycopersici]RAR06180.1 hypothetical protein DDE82_003530 [Stemphylium lycopersici]RAR14899.1 hypothetical protein DDE83_001737 [Stemphylium lycopersici]
MDIATTSRAYFAMPSPTPEEKISLQASNTVYTYHCLCSHLLLATTTPLPSLPTRRHTRDAAHIMPLPPAPSPASRTKNAASNNNNNDHYGLLLSTRQDRQAEIITSDSGFEKRYQQRCGRCDLVVGYQLDWQQFSVDRTGRREDYVFLLPGGFVKTSDMIAGKTASSASAGGGAGGAMGSTVSVTEVKA